MTSLLRAILVSALVPTATLQAQAVVLFDADHGISCIVDKSKNDCFSPPTNLVIENPFSLRVSRARLLTQYILRVNAPPTPTSTTAPISAGGEVLGLNLELPSNANTMTVAPTMPRLTVESVVNSFLEITDGRTPTIELTRQAREVSRSLEEIAIDVGAYRGTYNRVMGEKGVPFDCGPDGPRNGLMLDTCMRREYSKLELLTPAALAANPDAVFLSENRKWKGRFEDVQAFAHEYASNRVGTRAVELDSRITVHKLNMDVLVSNFRACETAVAILKTLDTPGTALQPKARAYIKSRILGTGGSESKNISETELNQYATAYESMLQIPDSLPRLSRHELETLLETLRPRLRSMNKLDSELAEVRTAAKVDIPQLEQSINDTQARVIRRLNSLYEKTRVANRESTHSADFGSSEKVIEFSVAVVERFRPYVLTWVAQPGASVSEAHEVTLTTGAFRVSPPPPQKLRLRWPIGRK